MSTRKIAIIVDPYSSGALYAPKFSEHGVSCIAVQSSLPLPVHFVDDFIPSDYIEVLSPSNEQLSCLSAQNVVAVIAGCDTGVVLTDDLSRRLGLQGNDPSKSAVRRYKDQMHEALKLGGLRHIETVVFNSFEDFSKRSEEFNDESTFVIKPINSAGSEGVRFAEGRQSLVKAMRASAWGEVNLLGEINGGFAIQPFIQGCEYVVDMVATREGFFVASVCQCHKVKANGSRFVCKSVDLRDPQDPELSELIEYARKAAGALGVILGPIHMELMWQRDDRDGPVMIEAGARLPGAGLPTFYSKVYNPDLLSAAVCTYLGMPIPTYGSKQECFGRLICLISEVERKFTGLRDSDIEALHGLKSYCGHKLYIKKHDILVRTIDFATCPGVIFLAHESLKRLEEDERIIRNIFSYHLRGE